MIKIENHEVMGIEHAIRGMRNPMNSWDKSDSGLERSVVDDEIFYAVGLNDFELMMKLAKAGSVHGKFRRMITVYVDITAPLYFWKEFDTYKVGTVANSCSTMHKIHAKEFTLGDFSVEHLLDENSNYEDTFSLLNSEGANSECCPTDFMKMLCEILNLYRERFLETHDKKYWWQMIQLLPSSYNQKRTIMMNYEVLANIYRYRKDHKLDEWREVCKWIEQLPYSEIIICNAKEE